MLRDEQGQALARYARESIAEALGGPRAERPRGRWADEPGATFVTLRRGDRLHGCIGSLEPRRSLADDVAKNAVAAALRDPRATPLELADVDELTVELGVLSPLSPVPSVDEATAIAALRPHVDGVVFRCAGQQGTFLPQVWRDLPNPADFLARLKEKAGFDPAHWSPDVRLYRYDLEKWIDPAERAS